MQTELIIEVTILVIIMLVTIINNVIMLFVLAWTDYLRNINRVYLYSIGISDLCIGLFIMPFAIYCAIISQYGHPDINLRVCHLQAYVTVIFSLAGLYSITWMNVDHYVAVRKPERYKVMMSPPRSFCWIAFAWIAAVSFCCPPLLSFQETKYYKEVFICTIYIGSETAYFVTAGLLALVPAFLVLMVTDIYLFTHGFKKKQKMYEAVLLEVSSRPRNYHISFLVSIVYVCTWMPWCILRIYSFFDGSIPQQLHFFTFWLAMGNALYKFFIYAVMSVEFRRGLNGLSEQCCKCTCFNRFLRQPNVTASRVVAKTAMTSGPSPAEL